MLKSQEGRGCFINCDIKAHSRHAGTQAGGEAKTGTKWEVIPASHFFFRSWYFSPETSSTPLLVSDITAAFSFVIFLDFWGSCLLDLPHGSTRRHEVEVEGGHNGVASICQKNVATRRQDKYKSYHIETARANMEQRPRAPPCSHSKHEAQEAQKLALSEAPQPPAQE